MARKKIREYTAKNLLAKAIPNIKHKSILITPKIDIETLKEQNPWLIQSQLVIKPDQLFGKRKKHGLVLINANFNQIKEYLKEFRNKEITIGKATDTLTHFLIEPFIPHEQEYYLAISSERDHDTIFFSEQGGIDIEENWQNVKKMDIPTLQNLEQIIELTKNETIGEFIKNSFTFFREHDFTYLEINPFVIQDKTIHLLDTVARVDDCASFKNQLSIELPKEFGKKSFPEEEKIAKLDKDSGSSLKLTVLNPKGRIWNILGGGGASIIYLDMIANIGQGNEIANYGESSGNPSKQESYEYAKTIIELMTKEKSEAGKVLFIVGGIANFTDVKNTFAGFIQAMEEYSNQLRKHNISIYVRRGGPNEEMGLKHIKEVTTKLNIPTQVHGPEISMHNIIQAAGDLL